jgi:hypothetical protein
MSWAVSAGFTAALQSGGHEPVIRLSVLKGGVEAASTDVLSPYLLQWLEGRVPIFNRADTRRSVSLSIGDTTGLIVPLAVGDLLDPTSGNEIYVQRGLIVNGVSELVPLGVFGIQTSEVTEQDGAVGISLNGMDRSYTIAQNQWRSEYTITAGTNTVTAIKNLITNRLTGVGTVLFNAEVTTQTIDADVTLGVDASDPWKDAQNLANGIGMEVFFDQQGVCVIRTVVDPEAAPVAYEYLTGETNLLLDPVVRSTDRATLRNGAIVNAEQTWLTFPVKAEVWDDDPASPTNRTLIGEHPEITNDPTCFDDVDCLAAATALFRQVVGVEEQIRWNSVVNPALDAGDVIRIQAQLALGGTARLVIESLEIPLSPEESMAGTTRRRRKV